MRFVRGILVALLVAPALVVVGATQALACSCVPPEPDAKAIKDASAVFSGTVTEIEPGVDIGFDTVTWTFDVDEVYKGEVETSQDVRSQTQSAACGLIFKEGKRYVVFAYDNKENLETNSCMNTRPLKEDEELSLEPVAAFEEEPPPEGPETTAGTDPFVVGSVGVVVLAAIVTVGALIAGRRTKAKNPGAPGSPEGPPS